MKRSALILALLSIAANIVAGDIDSVLASVINNKRASIGTNMVEYTTKYKDKAEAHNRNLAYSCKGSAVKTDTMYIGSIRVIKTSVSNGSGHGDYGTTGKMTLKDRYGTEFCSEIVTSFPASKEQVDDNNILAGIIFNNYYTSIKGHKEIMLGVTDGNNSTGVEAINDKISSSTVIKEYTMSGEKMYWVFNTVVLYTDSLDLSKLKNAGK